MNSINPCFDFKGMKVISSSFACTRVQFRFPVSKKKRIRKKWAKDQRNYKDDPKIFMMNDFFLVHPSLMSTIKIQLDEANLRQAVKLENFK